MNGAQALLQTLVANGVDTCFMNPGTSEMHFVAALDQVSQMRGVLGVFEGVATGAADGYARMAGKPAAVLLHLGPGLGNGLANLHNARKAFTPVINIVGDHALYHKQYDAQLESDIHTVARNVSSWIRTCRDPATIGHDVAAAVQAAIGPPGNVATLILPADVSWSDGGVPADPLAKRPAGAADDSAIESIARLLRSGDRVGLFLGGSALGERGVRAAARIAAATGAKVLVETFPRRLERGGGLPELERLAYLGEFAAMQLDGLQHLVLVDTKSPVTFFAYPDKPSDLVPDGCQVHQLGDRRNDAEATLERLALAVDAPAELALSAPARPDRPTGELTAVSVAATIGALLPDNAIVSDEAQTSGMFTPGATAGAPRHSWLTLTGGAIGQGLPAATGAAVACPDRPVLALEADGSALYTIQALWTQARDQLDVTTIIYNNRSYSILNMELGRVGADGGGPKAQAMLDLHRPNIDFVQIAEGFGVPACRPSTAEAFADALERALGEPGPHLIEAVIPPIF